MAQRVSGFERIPNEKYVTVEAWPVAVLLRQLHDIKRAWDPADDGDGHLARGPGAAYYLAEGPFHTKVFVCANGVTTTSLGRADTVEQAKELAQRHAEEVRQ